MASEPNETPHDLAMQALQRLVFGPLLFQAAVVLKRRGVLRELARPRLQAPTRTELQRSTGLREYALVVLLDAGEAAGLIARAGEGYVLTRMGLLLERDPLTEVNVNFVADVCYRPASHLDASLEGGEAAGLAELSDAPNVYEGLGRLADDARRSWLAFDHFYSDAAFESVSPWLEDSRVRSLLDLGGNTGRFCAFLRRRHPELQLCLADLPPQLATARAALEASGPAPVQLWPIDVLAEGATLPPGQDIVWMSQFLCCFSEPEIVRILGLARAALAPGGRIWVLETFIDHQQKGAAVVALEATSLYFACVANGKGRMYRSSDFALCLEQAGLRVARRSALLGFGHTLLECVPE